MELNLATKIERMVEKIIRIFKRKKKKKRATKIIERVDKFWIRI